MGDMQLTRQGENLGNVVFYKSGKTHFRREEGVMTMSNAPDRSN